MVLGKGEFPFNDYYLYKVWHQKEGRFYAVLVPDEYHPELQRTTIAWAKYLMGVKEGRILERWEEVDHIDDDKTNDNIENLQILTREENLKKEAKMRGKTMVYLRCPWCGKMFFRRKGNTHLYKQSCTFTACSRHCSSSFGALMFYHPDDPRVIFGLQNNVCMQYRLH